MDREYNLKYMVLGGGIAGVCLGVSIACAYEPYRPGKFGYDALLWSSGLGIGGVILLSVVEVVAMSICDYPVHIAVVSIFAGASYLVSEIMPLMRGMSGEDDGVDVGNTQPQEVALAGEVE